MRHLLLPLMLALAVALPPASRAADADGAFVAKGAGLATCERFVQAIDSQNARDIAQFGGWLYGYISALNQTSPDTYDLLPWQSGNTLLQAMRNYCAANPETRLFQAAAKMAETLAETRLTSQSRWVPIGDISPPGHFTEILRRAQVALQGLGIYQGEPNGAFDAAMQAALSDFQRRSNIKVTGKPDQATLFRLLAGQNR